jgi:hypothetical protein
MRQHAPYPNRVAADETVREMLAAKGQLHWTGRAKLVSDPPEKVKGAGEESWLMNVTGPLLASARAHLETTARSYGRTMRPNRFGYGARSRKRASGAG